MAVEIRFDAHQRFQRVAIDSVVDVLAGQEPVDRGVPLARLADEGAFGLGELVLGNSLSLSAGTVRTNLRRVQDRPVELEDGTVVPAVALQLRRALDPEEMPLDLGVEMETGTGKTYVYVRTIAELHRRYGFTKFVVVVPSVAVREGVLSTLRLLRDHVRDLYDGLHYDYCVYDSNALTRVRHFATASRLQIMVITIAAMTGDADSRIIHRPTDAMNGHAPVDLLRACRPVVIMDEPQSLDGPTQGPAIDELDPLLRVGYSATLPTDRGGRPSSHLVHRLTPVDAYAQRLVKRIGVLSVTKDPDAGETYVEITRITATAGAVTATATILEATPQGTRPTRVTLRRGDDLHELSGRLDRYRGWTVEDIHADTGVVELGNGIVVALGTSTSGSTDQQQRLMLRQAVECHLEKELQLLELLRTGQIPAAIKPLTLFFIEKVDHYAPGDAKLRRWFEAEYAAALGDDRFRALGMPDVNLVHDGYFAQDARGVAKEARADSKDAAAAFERIMQKKEELLDLGEPLRFIFSHSALAEGWDNPNVFTICNLQDGRSTMRKRQQVGRGLRLPVMANGDRCHVEEVNLLTVVAQESFVTFAAALQQEIERETRVSFAGRIVDVSRKQRIRLREEVLESSVFAELWARIAPRTTYRVAFSSDAVVADAVGLIDAMPDLEPVMFRVSTDVVAMGTSGLSGSGSTSRGEVVVQGTRAMPDVVGELCRRLPLSRATIVRILRECDRLDQAAVNPTAFVGVVADAINHALHGRLVEGIVYSPTGAAWSADLFRERHRDETVARRVVPVSHSITDHVVCDSEAEERFARHLDQRPDVRLFVKLPDWFTVPTPLGDHRPGWAIVLDRPDGSFRYLVRDTRGDPDTDGLRSGTERSRAGFGDAHFRSLGVGRTWGHDVQVVDPASADRPAE